MVTDVLSGWRGFILVALLGLGGCDKFELPTRTHNEDEARKAVQAGDFPKAVWMYEAVLDGTPKTADVHYKLALIYDDKLKDPVSALHHYRRYLKMTETTALKKEVEGYIERIELVLATRAADGGLMTKREAARIKNENLKLAEDKTKQKTEIAKLEQDLKEERKKPKAVVAKAESTRDKEGFSTNAKTAAAEKRIGSETKRYTVQKGDTLASLARRFYEDPQRWQDIADANQNVLNGGVNLRVGQVLVIP
jgi:LysM repeat protein